MDAKTMFTAVTGPRAAGIVAATERGLTKAYTPGQDLAPDSEILEVDMRVRQVTQCNTPEAIRRAITLASGDPERSVIVVRSGADFNR